MSRTFHLVIDAIVEYCQLQRPTVDQRMQMQDLVLAYLDKLPASDLKAICHHLASCKNVPKAVLLRLCEQDAQICRPILLTTDVLKDSDFIALVGEPDKIDHARIVARRLNLTKEITSALRDLNDEKVDRALDLRQRPLVQGADHTAIEYTDLRDDVDAVFMALCAEQNDVIIHTAFADRLGLQLNSCEILCADLTSRNLPTAMKFIGLSEATAWALYCRLANDDATQTSRVADAFRATYGDLTQSQSASIVSDWRMDELIMATRMNKAANQSSLKMPAAQKIA